MHTKFPPMEGWPTLAPAPERTPALTHALAPKTVSIPVPEPANARAPAPAPTLITATEIVHDAIPEPVELVIEPSVQGVNDGDADADVSEQTATGAKKRAKSRRAFGPKTTQAEPEPSHTEQAVVPEPMQVEVSAPHSVHDEGSVQFSLPPPPEDDHTPHAAPFKTASRRAIPDPEPTPEPLHVHEAVVEVDVELPPADPEPLPEPVDDHTADLPPPADDMPAPAPEEDYPVPADDVPPADDLPTADDVPPAEPEHTDDAPDSDLPPPPPEDVHGMAHNRPVCLINNPITGATDAADTLPPPAEPSDTPATTAAPGV